MKTFENSIRCALLILLGILILFKIFSVPEKFHALVLGWIFAGMIISFLCILIFPMWNVRKYLGITSPDDEYIVHDYILGYKAETIPLFTGFLGLLLWDSGHEIFFGLEKIGIVLLLLSLFGFAYFALKDTPVKKIPSK